MGGRWEGARARRGRLWRAPGPGGGRRAAACSARLPGGPRGREAGGRARAGGGRGFGRAAGESAGKPGKARPRAPVGEAPESLAAALAGTGVVFVGDEGQLNRAVADLAAAALSYVPLHAEDVVKQAASEGGQGDVEAQPGGPGGDLKEEDLGAAEALVLESLSTSVRCSVSTCGGGRAAAARPFCWRHLHGHLCIWLDCSQEEEPDGTAEPQREAYALADLQVRVDRAVLAQSDAADRVLESVVPAAQAVLLQSPGLVKKKQLYVKLGCKGDWPNLSLEGTGLEEQAKAIEQQMQGGGGGQIRI